MVPAPVHRDVDEGIGSEPVSRGRNSTSHGSFGAMEEAGDSVGSWREASAPDILPISGGARALIRAACGHFTQALRLGPWGSPAGQTGAAELI